MPPEYVLQALLDHVSHSAFSIGNQDAEREFRRLGMGCLGPDQLVPNLGAVSVDNDQPGSIFDRFNNTFQHLPGIGELGADVPVLPLADDSVSAKSQNI